MRLSVAENVSFSESYIIMFARVDG